MNSKLIDIINLDDNYRVIGHRNMESDIQTAFGGIKEHVSQFLPRSENITTNFVLNCLT